MPVLTLDVGGPDEMDLDCEGGGHAAPRTVGNRGYSASGSEWSQIRDELMVVPFVSAPLPWSQIATIRALFALGARVNCAGDVFNRAGTIICSGTITDELHETADRGTVNGTLFEIGSTTSYTPATSQFLLTSVESPDSGGDPTILVGYPDSFSYSGDAPSGYRALDGVAPNVFTGIATTTGGTPERSWLSLPLNPGIATGTPYIVVEVQQDPGPYTGTTIWTQMDTYAKLYQKRGATTIAGPITSSTIGVGLGGGAATMTFASPIVWTIALDDQLLIEFYSTIALNLPAADNGQRQLIDYGMVPGPRQPPRLVIGGNLTSAP